MYFRYTYADSQANNLRSVCPLLNHIIETSFTDSAVTKKMTGEAVASNLRLLLVNLLRLSTCEGTKIIIIEDAQWLDKASWQLARDIIASKIEKLMLVLVTRPMEDVEIAKMYSKSYGVEI